MKLFPVPAVQMPHVPLRAPAERTSQQGEEGQPLPRLREIIPGRLFSSSPLYTHVQRKVNIRNVAMEGRSFCLLGPE